MKAGKVKAKAAAKPVAGGFLGGFASVFGFGTGTSESAAATALSVPAPVTKLSSSGASIEPIRLQAVKQAVPCSVGQPPLHAASHQAFLDGVCFWETVVSGDSSLDSTVQGVVSDLDNIVTAMRFSDGSILQGALGTPLEMYQVIGKMQQPPPARPRRGALWRRARFMLDDGSRIGQAATGAGAAAVGSARMTISAIVDGIDYGVIATDISGPARPVVLFTSRDAACLPAASILGGLRADACEDAIRGGAALPAPEGALSHGGLLWSKTYPKPLLSRANQLRPLQQIAARMLHNRQVVLSATTGARVALPVVGGKKPADPSKGRTEAEVIRVVSQRALPPNRWSHLAFVLDGHHAKVYINGEIVANRPVPAGLMLAHEADDAAPVFVEAQPASGAGADDTTGPAVGGLVGAAADDFEAVEEDESSLSRLPPAEIESIHPYPDNSNTVQ